jgi:thermostable 8-oxoguanine DNA glycosylase
VLLVRWLKRRGQTQQKERRRVFEMMTQKVYLSTETILMSTQEQREKIEVTAFVS